MFSLRPHGAKSPWSTFAMVLAIGSLFGSTARAQYGAGGSVGSLGQGGYGLQGYGGRGAVGGYGFNPGFNSLGYGGNVSAIYGGPGYPFYGDGTSYGYGLGYGYPTTFYDTGFLAPILRPRRTHRR